jgi:hypothetical protein
MGGGAKEGMTVCAVAAARPRWAPISPCHALTVGHPLSADLRRSLAGAVLVTVVFVVWVSLYQTKWEKWGSFGEDIMVIKQNHDTRWWMTN